MTAALVATVLGVSAIRFAFLAATEVRPPGGAVAREAQVVVEGPIGRTGESYVRRRGEIWEMGITGEPRARGSAVSRLLRGPMIDDEQELYEGFRHAIPFAPARWAIIAMGRWRFRAVDRFVPLPYREEIAGIGAGFAPDPFESTMPSYQRFLFLYTIYDIALSFEKSPLLGCTTVSIGDAGGLQEVAGPQGGDIESTRGHVLLARAFDMETAGAFDRDKVVYLVREPGRIPFASVGWPGFVGVVSGMNREGVGVVVHGGRARAPRNEGLPVVFSLREVLATARSTADAVRTLSAQHVMVSHIVIVVDASGETAIVERAPGAEAFVRRTRGRVAKTNHFEGPLSEDPRDAEVRRHTSTLPRKARADVLVEALPAAPSVADLVALLRDRSARDGTPNALGDRKSIDALIATHGVVFDATARSMWVSEAPHLLGRFVRFDLRRLLADGFDPASDPSAGGGAGFAAVAGDALLTSGAYRVREATIRRR